MDDFIKTRFILLRHGEPVGGKIFRGSTDDALTEQGWQQLEKSVNGLTFDEIISSPLKRCSEFAFKLQQQKQCSLQIENNLQELHLGDWEGLTPAQVQSMDAKGLTEFWTQPSQFTPPNAEPFIDFEQRILSVWQDIQSHHVSTQKEKVILVICHAGVMMVLLKNWLQIPVENILNIKLNYASKIHVDIFDDSHKLKPQIYIEHGYDF